VSRWALEADGILALEDATAGLTGTAARACATRPERRTAATCYAIDADARRIFGWRVGDQGALAPIGSWDGPRPPSPDGCQLGLVTPSRRRRPPPGWRRSRLNSRTKLAAESG